MPPYPVSVPGLVIVKLKSGAASGPMAVEPLPSGLFRVAVQPWLWEGFGFDDIVELRKMGSDEYEFVRVVERSSLARHCWIVGRETAESKALQALLDDVSDAGGHWERAFGGAVFIALPADSEINPDERMKRIAAPSDR